MQNLDGNFCEDHSLKVNEGVEDDDFVCTVKHQIQDKSLQVTITG